jgi:hypothetical protein
MTTIKASQMPARRLKRVSPWILVALVFLLALSLSIDAIRRDSSVAVAPPPAPDSSSAAALSLKTIPAPLSAAEQRAAGLKKIPPSGGRPATLKEIPPAGGRLQRTRFGQEGSLVKMVPQEKNVGEPRVKMIPQEKIAEEPLAALGPELRPARANPDPNSVFAWGPWSQTTSLARVDGLVEQDAAPQQGFVRTALVTQARQDTAVSRPAAEGLTPPGSNSAPAFTPPAAIPPIGGLPGGSGGSGHKGDRPGWGHGDRNHSHHHRNQQGQHGHRGR